MKTANREHRAASISLALLSTLGYPSNVSNPLRMPGKSWFDAAVSTALYQPVPLYDIAPGGLWKHSTVCAFLSRLIAGENGLCNPDEAYLAGLLHDLGIAALDRFMRQRPELVRLVQSSGELGHIAEEMTIGFNHAYVSSLICQRWNLGTSLCDAIAEHHEWITSSSLTNLAAILRIVDAVSPMSEGGALNPKHRTPLALEAMDVLGMDSEDVNRLASRVPLHLRTA